MAKIYVSSTFLDLQEHRAQVEKVIRRMGHEDVAMEYYVAEDQRPVDRCLSDVAACDLYIGIFAWRYGWIPSKNNRKKISITEMEYRQAEKFGKPCLIFTLDGKAAWPPDFIDDDKTQIKKLRNELCEKHSTGPGFKSPDELGRLVAEAIHKWEKERGLISIASAIPEYNLDKYYEALRKRYGVLALEGLTPPQKEEYLQIHLRSVFVEQNVRESPPPIELPKEVWEKLSLDQEIHEEDLPSGIILEDVKRAREAYYEKPSRPVLDMLTDPHYQRTIILGDPGSGKSTLARYVILSLIEPGTDEKLTRAFGGYLPLLIELRSYAGLCADGTCTTFLEFLEYLGKTEGWNLTKEALHNHLKNDGHTLVIFDGLDEIFDPELRETITNRIVGFTTDYPKVRVIVTSRVIGYRRKILTDAGFTHFTLQDLDEKQVKSFVTRWYDLAMSDRPDEAKERRERILKSFQDSASIRQLAGNPMLLTIMAIIGKHQELPRERWKLYDHAASVLIQHWDVNKHLKDEKIEADFIGEDDKEELLRRLAYRMQGGDGGLAGNYIHRDGLQAEFENYLKERYNQTPERAKVIAEAMIQQFRERNFILSLYGANLYCFLHRAFLEYFCASAFVWKFEKTKELTIEQLKTDVYGKHWEDQSWHEVLRLICGMIDEKWVRQIVDFLTKEVYGPWPTKFEKSPPWNISLAVACLSESRNINMIENTAVDVLHDICCLIEHVLTNNDIRVNLDGEGQVSSYSYEPILKEDFFEQQLFPYVISMGTKWPGRDTFIDELYNTKSFAIMWVLDGFWDLLGTIGANLDKFYKIFTESLMHSSIDRGGLVSAFVKYSHEDARTYPFLRDRAIQDDDAEVRCVAVYALAQYFREDPQTLPILHDRAVQDDDADVRSDAVNALAQYFREDPQTLPLLRDRAENDPTPWLSERAKELIAELEGKKE